MLPVVHVRHSYCLEPVDSICMELPGVDSWLPLPSAGAAGAASGDFEGKILRTSGPVSC